MTCGWCLPPATPRPRQPPPRAIRNSTHRGSIGSVDGVLSAGPEAFTADSHLSQDISVPCPGARSGRTLFSHGPEVPETHKAMADY